MMNGCICCTVRSGDLGRDAEEAGREARQAEHSSTGVIIETTGMADAAGRADLLVDEDIQKLYSLDCIVTVCDAKHIEQRLDDEKPEGVENEARRAGVLRPTVAPRQVRPSSRSSISRASSAARASRSNGGGLPIGELVAGWSRGRPGPLASAASLLGRVLKMDPEFLNALGRHCARQRHRA